MKIFRNRVRFLKLVLHKLAEKCIRKFHFSLSRDSIASISKVMEFWLRFYAFVTKVLNFLLIPIFYIVFELFVKHEKLPPLKSPLLEICAVDLAEKIRNREVKNN